MRRPTAAFATPHSFVTESKGAGLKDYINMHGMLCRPSTARRTLNSFTGCVMFLPHDYSRDAQALSPGEFHGFVLLQYYILCFFSFTTLATIFNQTEFLVGREETLPTSTGRFTASKQAFVAEHDDSLRVDPCVFEYIQQQTNSKSFELKRRFEYRFGGFAKLSVVMFHFVSDNGLLHLVEVYRIENALIRYIVTKLLTLWKWMEHRLLSNNIWKNRRYKV